MEKKIRLMPKKKMMGRWLEWFIKDIASKPAPAIIKVQNATRSKCGVFFRLPQDLQVVFVLCILLMQYSHMCSGLAE